MKLTKAQWQKVGGIVLTALLGIAAVLGWYFPVEAPEARVRERISIDARDDAYLYNGADLYVYSDDHSTQKFHVDGATGNIDSEGTLDVAGGILSASGSFTITDNVNITGTLDVDSTLNADGATTLNSTLDVDGNISSGTGAVTVTDAVNITSTLDVDSTLNADGATTLNSTLDVDGNISSGTGSFTVADTLRVTGIATFDADVIVDDVFNIDDTAYTSVGAQTLSPTASFYTLAPTSVLTLTLGTSGVNAGDIVLFVSTVTTGTTIVDTTATAGGGDRALGENDFIGFIYTGSVWAEAFYSDNS